MTHHPHLHMIVPGGGISLDGKKWLACRPGFFLPVRVLSRLFRQLFLDKLAAAHASLKLAVLMVQREMAAGSLVAFTCVPALRTRTLQAAYHTERPRALIGTIESVVRVAREVLTSKVPLLPMDLPS